MTVSAINQTAMQPISGTQDTSQTAWQQRMQQAVGPVAQLFGESPQQLMQQLQSGGSSLSTLAQSQGVSQSSLLSAIQQGLQQAGGPASSMSSTQLSNLASTIATRTHHGHHHHHGGGGGVDAVNGADGASSTSDISALLGTDADGNPLTDPTDGSTSTSTSGLVPPATSLLAQATTSQQVDLAQVLFSLRATQPA